MECSNPYNQYSYAILNLTFRRDDAALTLGDVARQIRL